VVDLRALADPDLRDVVAWLQTLVDEEVAVVRL
jgi:hypothetical protein